MRRGTSFTLTLVVVGTVLLLASLMLISIGTDGLGQFQYSTSGHQVERDVREACLQLGNVINQQYCNQYVKNCRDPQSQATDNNPRTAADQSCNWHKYAQEDGNIDALTDGKPLVLTSHGTFNCRTEGHIQTSCPVTPTIDGTPATPSAGSSDDGDNGDGGGNEQNQIGGPAGGPMDDTAGAGGIGEDELNPDFNNNDMPSTVTLWSQRGLSGEHLSIATSQSSLPFMPRSINVSDGYVARLWSEFGYSGKQVTVVGTANNLGFNDITASVDVTGGDQCEAVLYGNSLATDFEDRVWANCTSGCTCTTSQGESGPCNDFNAIPLRIGPNNEPYEYDWTEAASAVEVRGGSSCQATLYSQADHSDLRMTVAGRSTGLGFWDTARSVEILSSVDAPAGGGQDQRGGDESGDVTLAYDGVAYTFTGENDEDALDWIGEDSKFKTDVSILAGDTATLTLPDSFSQSNTVTIGDETYSDQKLIEHRFDDAGVRDITVSSGDTEYTAQVVVVSEPEDGPQGVISRVCHELFESAGPDAANKDEINVSVTVQNTGNLHGNYRLHVYDATGNSIREGLQIGAHLDVTPYGQIGGGETATATLHTNNWALASLQDFARGYTIELEESDKGVVDELQRSDDEVPDDAQDWEGSCTT